MQPPYKLREGDYILILGKDSPDDRTEGARIMQANGCRSTRFEIIDSNRLKVHGYLEAGLEFPEYTNGSSQQIQR